MEALFTTQGLISLLTLTCLEIVLGIDNIIFISIICDKLPINQQQKIRNIGILLAMLVRIALLFSIAWIVGLKDDLFTLFDIGFSGRDLILLGGGLFLMYKSTKEIHEKFDDDEENDEYQIKEKRLTPLSAIMQIVLIDIVFSFDSILTAVGLVQEVAIMIAAVVISLLIMMFFAGNISKFVNEHPSIKMLALTFLVMIGFLLVVEGLDVAHIPKGYIYFAMGYAFLVELINIRARKKKEFLKQQRKNEGLK